MSEVKRFRGEIQRSTGSQKMSKDQVLYDVCSWIVDNNESAEALNFGITKVYSGKVVNVSLSFATCWSSNAGHNYEKILKKGRKAILQEVNGLPIFI